MANTRFNYDDDRTIKRLQEATDIGRYMLNTPGLGTEVPFVLDPHIVPQKWGGNLYSNVTELESSLMGINKPLQKDCLHKSEYTKYMPTNSFPMSYPTNDTTITDEPRTVNPAWQIREQETNRFQYLPYNPQENVFLNFHNNWNTRILTRDNYKATPYCLYTDASNHLPKHIN